MDGRKQTLDAEYAAGSWEYLRGSEELSRFSVVVGYCHYFKPSGTVLEVGCGEGILQERLDHSKYSRYAGIDISSEAIRRASEKGDHKTCFVAADAATFIPSANFDVIIFNECLEYFQDPLALVHRYDPFLNAGGIYIVSIFEGVDTAQSKRIWRALGRTYQIRSQTRVSNQSGYSWIIKVLTPRSGV